MPEHKFLQCPHNVNIQ